MATISWISTTSGSWSDGANWQGGVAPGPADDAVMNLTSAETITIDSAVSVNAVAFDDPAATYQVIAPGALSATADIVLDGAAVTVTGSLSASRVELDAHGTITFTGAGTVNADVVTMNAGGIVTGSPPLEPSIGTLSGAATIAVGASLSPGFKGIPYAATSPTTYKSNTSFGNSTSPWPTGRPSESNQGIGGNTPRAAEGWVVSDLMIGTITSNALLDLAAPMTFLVDSAPLSVTAVPLTLTTETIALPASGVILTTSSLGAPASTATDIDVPSLRGAAMPDVLGRGPGVSTSVAMAAPDDAQAGQTLTLGRFG